MIPFVILTIGSEDDRAYMTLLYERHRALMLKTAWEFTRERADVEDVVSDSCVALMSHPAQGFARRGERRRLHHSAAGHRRAHRLANSAALRSKVMQLLMEFNDEKGETYFSFTEDESAAFDVPDRWCGDYFPSYIPEGFTIYDYDPDFGAPFIEYRNKAQNQIYFDEMDENTDLLAGTDNSVISMISINGYPGCPIEGPAIDGVTGAVTIVWQNDVKWFSVTTFGVSTEEALRVARSVRQIVQER